MVWDAQHLHRLITLIDTIRWLVISIGRYVNIWGYRLRTGAVNINRKGSEMSMLPQLCGVYRLSQIEQY